MAKVKPPAAEPANSGERYFNLYFTRGNLVSHEHDNKDAADLAAGGERIACLKITMKAELV